MVMFMHTYRDKINDEEVDAFMEKYSLDCFWSNLLNIARQYLEFDAKRYVVAEIGKQRINLLKKYKIIKEDYE